MSTHKTAMAVAVILTLLVTLVGVILAPGQAQAAGVSYTVGDVFAGVGNGQIKHFSSTGALLDTLTTSASNAEDTGMAFDLAGNLYATNFGGNSVSKFDNKGNLIGPFGSGYNADPESILTNAAGDFYVGQADGSHQVLKFGPSGNSLAAFSPATENRGTDWIDLAADQCTLLYTSEGSHVKRFNVCTNTQEADFATLPIAGAPGVSSAYALRIRPNGDVMVAASQEVFRLDKTGAIVQTYPKPAGESSILFALNLDPDLKSFWTAGYSSGNVYRIDIASGTIISQFNAGAISPSLAGLAVFGEIVAAQPKLELAPTSATQQVLTSVTLKATVLNTLDASDNVTFTVTGANPQTATVPTVGGVATFTYTGVNAGVDTVVATTTTTVPPAKLTSNTSTITWTKIPTKLTYNGDTSQDYHDSATLSATLVRTDTNAGISGQTITFTLGSQTCSGVTDASGKASCSITLSQKPGPFTVNASFAGNNTYEAASASAAFTINKEQTTLTYTGPTVIPNGQPVTLGATLLEDGTTPPNPSGQTIVFTLGSGTTAQTCSGTADSAGKATCTIASVNQPLGPGMVSASFAGDDYYLPSSASTKTVIFAFLGKGAFVVGDKSDTGAVTFWDDEWYLKNTLSGGSAPASFKGFAGNTKEPPVCGGNWTTDPGNSPPPADSIPAYMGVLVSSSVSKTGSTISGNTVEIVVVETNPGYAPNPGHPGTGTVVAVYCK